MVFGLDTSTSMGGVRIEAVKKAVILGLDVLRPTDSFNFVTFGDEAKRWKIGSLLATEKNKEEAKEFLRNIRPRGGKTLFIFLNTIQLQYQ